MSDWKPDYTVTPRRIVCAANRRRTDGHIICGARHWDKLMRAQAIQCNTSKIFGHSFNGWDQGFIDQFGDWLTREEAWVVAEEQGQIRRRCGGGERLYSENLY